MQKFISLYWLGSESMPKLCPGFYVEKAFDAAGYILHCNIIIMLRSIGMHLDPLPYVNWKLSEHHISKAEASH